MLRWFTDNAGTVVVTLVLIALVAGIVRLLIRDKKKGKTSCGGKCGCCPMSGACHRTETPTGGKGK